MRGFKFHLAMDSTFQPAGYALKTLPWDGQNLGCSSTLPNFHLGKKNLMQRSVCQGQVISLPCLFLYLFSGKSCCDYLKGLLWEENEIMYETVPLNSCMDSIMIRLLLMIQNVCRTGQWWVWSTAISVTSMSTWFCLLLALIFFPPILISSASPLSSCCLGTGKSYVDNLYLFLIFS